MENTKQMNPTVKKVLSIVFNVLFYAFLVVLFVFAISNIRSKKNNIPNIFGVGYLTVQTGSMTGTFEAGDVIWVKVANEKKIEKLEIGDVITFYDPSIADSIAATGGEDDGTYLNTHRIVDITENENGTKTYICQGDYVKIYYPETVYGKDNPNNAHLQFVTKDEIRAIYIKNMGKGMTGLLKFAKSSLGFGLCIVLPTALLLVYEIVMLVRNIFKLKQEKLQAQMAETQAAQQEDLELQKQRMREELLAELRAEQAKGEEAKEEQVEEEQKTSEEVEEEQPAEEEKEPEEENKEEN